MNGGFYVQVANAGFMALGILIPILTVIFWVVLMVAVFQMRNSMLNLNHDVDREFWRHFAVVVFPELDPPLSIITSTMPFRSSLCSLRFFVV